MSPCEKCGVADGRRRTGLCDRCYKKTRYVPRPRKPKAAGPCSKCGAVGARRYISGMCVNCYRKAQRAANYTPRPQYERKPCSREGCDVLTDKHPVVGLCNRHYDERKRRREGIMPRQPAPVRTCGEKHCDRPVKARNRCILHYHRWLRAQHSGNPLYKSAAKMPKKVTRGVWTERGGTVTLCWPPRDAGPDWTCPHPDHQEER